MIKIIPSSSVVFCKHTTWTWCITFLFCMFCRIEHEKLHAKHKGHEAMHMEMILILFSTLIVAQVLLVKWKKHYYKSFQVKKKKTVKLSSCQTMNAVIGYNRITIQTYMYMYFRCLLFWKFENETQINL